MKLECIEDALELTNVLLKYNEESTVVDILADLDIYFDNDDLDEIPTNYDTNVLKTYFIKYLDWNTKDIINEIEDPTLLLSLLDENDIENVIENNTKLLDYFADRITVHYMTVRDAMCGCAGYGKRSILSEIDYSAEFILLHHIRVDQDCPISESLAQQIVIKYLQAQDDYYEFDDVGLLNMSYADEYVYYDILENGVDLQPYLSKLVEQIKGYEQELIDACNMTIEEFKNLKYSENYKLNKFLLEYTDIVDLAHDDILS